MKFQLKAALGAAAILIGTQAMAQITMYEGEGFRGRAVTADRSIGDLGRMGFNDRTGSVVIEGGRWEVCEHERFQGRCAVLRRGNYDSLRNIGMDYQISSVRPAEDWRTYRNEVPVSEAPLYEYRQRPNERTFEVPVTSARAVMGAGPTQRCWMERQQVPTGSSQPNVGGAVAGALIGGILGHQIGGGSGRDAATGLGVVAGAAIGANAGNNNSGYAVQDVQRCDTPVSGTPAYWDVTYNFRGMEHRLQMAAPPGSTIVVNDSGQPRQ